MCFLTISPREGSAPRAARSATSGTGSSCHFAAATSTKMMMQIIIKRNEREQSRTSGLENSLG